MKLTKLAVTFIAIGFGISLQAYADARYIIQVDNANKGVVKAFAKQQGGELHVDGNGFLAASFKGKDLFQVKGLLNHPHVKLVEFDQPRYLMGFSDDAGDPMSKQLTPYAVYQSQADQLNFDPSAGIKVCVIDSGLDSSNPDFVWSNISGDDDSGTGNWNENGGPHGTHVAGTIGADDNDIGVVGMAPGVAMHIIKVFNEDGWGYSSDLVYATELCREAGANIINMSLGGGGTSSVESKAFESFVEAGGLVVAAAGNDGNNVRSYPAGYPSVMMVGANDADNNIADFSQFPSCNVGRGKNVTTDESICVEVTAGGVDTLSTYPAGTATIASLTVDGNTISSSAMENLGQAVGQTYYMGIADTVDGGANGNICVIDRGSISFYDKVANCEASGGIGAIVINNEAGMLYATLGDTNTTTIPALSTALEDRATILAASTATVSIGLSDYGYMSGTSMATPAVSGVAALVWSRHTQCTGSEIRAALKATALDSGAVGHDVYFGYGIVQAAAADAYLTANGCAGGDNNSSGEFTLSANGYKSRGVKIVELSFSGAASENVDLYRDGNLIATVSVETSYIDTITSKGGGTYIYKACEAGSSNCTADTSVVF